MSMPLLLNKADSCALHRDNLESLYIQQISSIMAGLGYFQFQENWIFSKDNFTSVQFTVWAVLQLSCVSRAILKFEPRNHAWSLLLRRGLKLLFFLICSFLPFNCGTVDPLCNQEIEDRRQLDWILNQQKKENFFKIGTAAATSLQRKNHQSFQMETLQKN